MQGKFWIVTALALTTACGAVSAVQADSGRSTRPNGTRPTPSPPPSQEQKPSSPPPSQRPTGSGQSSDQERQAKEAERVRMFEKYRHHKG